PTAERFKVVPVRETRAGDYRLVAYEIRNPRNETVVRFPTSQGENIARDMADKRASELNAAQAYAAATGTFGMEHPPKLKPQAELFGAAEQPFNLRGEQAVEAPTDEGMARAKTEAEARARKEQETFGFGPGAAATG